MRALDNALKLARLRKEVFDNDDLLRLIKSHMDCDSILSLCLSNKEFCEKVNSIGDDQLRIDVAKCIVQRMNVHLQAIIQMFTPHILGAWVNEPITNDPEDRLFIEMHTDFFAVSLQLNVNAMDFIHARPNFKLFIRKIGKLLSLLFKVNIKGEYLDLDRHDPGYLSFQILFNQRIPRDVILRLPFASELHDHDNRIRISPIDHIDMSTISFPELLGWTHPRRSRRLLTEWL